MTQPAFEKRRGVHGDIRHLESHNGSDKHQASVHGDIRHLEKLNAIKIRSVSVHGDIRHLEIASFSV